MKYVLAVFILIAGGGVPAASRSADEAGQRLTGTELRVCRADGARCLTLTSPAGQGSQLKAMQKLRDAVVTVEEPKSARSTKYRADWALVDLELNEITLIQKRPRGEVKEITFNLETLEHRDGIFK